MSTELERKWLSTGMVRHVMSLSLAGHHTEITAARICHGADWAIVINYDPTPHGEPVRRQLEVSGDASYATIYEHCFTFLHLLEDVLYNGERGPAFVERVIQENHQWPPRTLQ